MKKTTEYQNLAMLGIVAGFLMIALAGWKIVSMLFTVSQQYQGMNTLASVAP